MWKFAASFLLISGIASLTYQVVWVRLLGLSMGSTSASISTVLAAFFLGLALGSYLAERITRNRINSFTPYLILELIIGLSGLMLLPILLNLDQLMAIYPQWGTELPFKFAITMALLILPTLCMGATFPVMAALVVRKNTHMGLRISQLYSLNTAGAVLGAALSGFVFIPTVGLDGAVYIAFILNMSIVGMILLNKNRLVPAPLEDQAPKPEGSEEKKADEPEKKVKIEKVPFRFRALIILFCTGFVSIASEVGWTKYLSIFAGSTIYGFAAILTVFLIGIATGSWFIRRHLEYMKAPQTWMALGLVLLGASLLLTRGSLSLIPYFYEATNHLQGGALLQNFAKYAIVFVMIFIPTFIFGALFPLNLKLYCGNLLGVRQRIGKAYAVNTVASIAGSIAAGFWIIPLYGTDVLLTAMAAIILLLPILFIPSVPENSLKAVVSMLVVLGVGSHWFFSRIDYQHLISSVDYEYDVDARKGKDPDYLYLGEGKTGIVSAVTYDGVVAKLQNNGLNESLINTKDPLKRLIAETLLGIIPYILQDDAKTAFVVGFGGGVTSETLTWTRLKSIRVVELEPKVIDAVTAIHGGEKPPALQDNRVKLEFNDARNTLLVEDKRYDIIASQPSHPWRAGAANVFTQDFFQIVNDRLNDTGIYAQWVNLFNMDTYTLKSLAKSFYTVFPHGFSMANLETGDFILLGAKQPIVFDFARMNRHMSLPKIQRYLSAIEVVSARDLFWYFSLSREQLVKTSENVPANRDTNLLSEVRLSMLDKVREGSSDDPYKFIRDQYTIDVVSYLKESNAAQQIFEIAQLFLKFDDLNTVEQLAAQLEKINSNLALGLKYQAYVGQGKYKEAWELYDSQADWPSEIHAQQAQFLFDQRKFDQAEKIISKIDSVKIKRPMQARALFEKNALMELEKWVAQSDEERVWQLLAKVKLDKKNNQKNVMELSQIIKTKDAPLPAIRFLLHYYSKKDDELKMNQFSRLLVSAIDKQTQDWSYKIQKALSYRNIKFARTLLDQIKTLNPLSPKVSQLELDIQTAVDTVVQISE